MFLMKNKALLVITIVLALQFLAAGLGKLVGVEPMQEAFARFGFPIAFMYFIGICEVAGAIGLFIRKTAMLAAIGLAIIMVGAVGCHLMFDPPPPQVIHPLVVLVLASTAAYLNMKLAKSDSEPPATAEA